MKWMRTLFGRRGAGSAPEHEQKRMPEVDLLAAAERDAIVAKHLAKHLPSLGLGQISPRSWIDGSKPPARRMFEIVLVKGQGMKTRWGFSLDFVPHITGWNLPPASTRKIGWHRTDKNAMLDVIVDPCDLPHFSSLFGADRLDGELESYLPAAVERACETWRRGETWHGMLQIVQEIRERKVNCFGFCNYTQLPLAFAFLSAKIGDLAAAEAELEAYARRHKLDDAVELKLIKHARELGVVTEKG